MKELGRHLLILILAVVFSGLIRNSIFDQDKQLDKDDFSIIETAIAIDKDYQIKTFFLKNNSSFPINTDNVLIEYSSNYCPSNANFTNSKDEFLPIIISKNPKSIFDISLPNSLKNEDCFSISLRYKSNQKIEDNLIVKIQNSDDSEYVTISSKNSNLADFIDEVRNTMYVGKSILISETFIILYALFYLLTRLVGLCIEIYKRHEDQKFIQGGGKKQFIKKK